MVTSGYTSAAEYDVAGITDPFLQAKTLRLLRTLGMGSVKASDEMNDILAQVATNTEGTKNTGNAILYECVLTIMSIEAESGLRVLGINILGRFLLSRDNNIRYVALATLQRVVSVDMKAVQRHRATIIDCLKDNDISIRKRALDVAYVLITEENIKSLTKELLEYLLTAETAFKEELCSRICDAVQKYAPNRRWQIDTLIKVMCLAGNYVKEEQRETFCRVVASTPELHSYAVIKLYFNMKEGLTQGALVHVGVWCLGEFGDHLFANRAVGPDNQPIHVVPAEVLDVLADVARKPPTSDKASTHCLVASALIKLVTRCPNEVDRIRKMLRRFETSLHVDLQQRSCEFLELLEAEWDSSRAGILDRMPVPEKDIASADSRDVGNRTLDVAAPAGASSSGKALPAAAASGPAGDLLDLLDTGPAPAPAVAAQGPAATGGPAGDLLDFLGGGGSSQASTAAPVSTGGPGDLGLMDIFGGDAAAPVAQAPQETQTVAFDKGGLRILMDCRREADGSSTIVARFCNSLSVPMTNFVFEAAVPKYIRLNMQPATGQILPPCTDAVSQTMTCVNSTSGEKGLLMKLRIGYVVNGAPVQEMAQVGNFPPGF